MTKAWLEAKLKKTEAHNDILRATLSEIRQQARTAISNKNVINNIWLLEFITTSFAKTER